MNDQSRDYIGDYFMAVYHGPAQGWHILQIDPVVYLAKTDKRELAIELVNRLDVTGSTPVGIKE
jgi:hypothetical protein